MSLEEQINADIKASMLAKESAKLEALRAVKSAILLLKTSADGSAPDAELKALQKMVKKTKKRHDDESFYSALNCFLFHYSRFELGFDESSR